MTYLNFLILFIFLPICILGFYFVKSNSKEKRFFKNAIAVLCTLAFIWTTPWDNYLVANNVWSYGPDRVLAVIGWVPIEEYAFFFLQTIMTGLYVFWLHTKYPIKEKQKSGSRLPSILIFGVIFIYGIVALNNTQSLYLGLILIWAIPICLLQWSIGAMYLHSNFKFYLASVIPPTIYLWLADNYAISDGIWHINPEHIIGLQVASLPLEEAIFFLVTNMMVAQGIILFYAMKEIIPAIKLYKRSESEI